MPDQGVPSPANGPNPVIVAVMTVLVAMTMSLLTALAVGFYWSLLVLLTTFRLLLLPFRSIRKSLAG